MSSVKMIKFEDGDYVPEECCTFGRNFETGEMEIDDVILPCGCDCSRGGTIGISCESCVIQKIMNAYGEARENIWIPVEERMPEELDYVFVTVKYPSGVRLTEVAHIINGKWAITLPSCNGKVIAWMPLPEPYKKEGE